ncbi:Transcriptional regulator xre [Furfurilactobacillus rossiae]|uniref:helix-turn-helix domain-containing protein n=1 Tax=Furfurilactobacillus rossiae TaxID=231049 RepID=UPI0015BFDF5B|nr:helix-turn-helix domain-containing protein [Furfurilactobacillus rossiae]MCF6165820.1 helix-turn-helix domain-containing protein [Furfurilactobacillus rossiae]QLE63055.1 Transcriptional regulator xre [Furfurilactobacillus rossiae]
MEQTVFGITCRQIRRNKGLTQKEVYLGVMSRSYYAAFEHGDYSISAEKLIAVVANLRMTMAEFMFIYRGYQASEPDQLHHHIQELYNHWQLDELMAIYEQYRHSNDQLQRFNAILAYALVYITSNHSLKMSTTPIDELWAYFMNLKSWTLTDAKTADILLSLFRVKSPQHEQYIFNEIVNTYHRFEKLYDQENNLASGLANAYLDWLQTLLLEHRYSLAHEVVDQMRKESLFDQNMEATVLRRLARVLVDLYDDYPQAKRDGDELLNWLSNLHYGQTNILTAIFEVHKLRGQTHYERYKMPKQSQ